MLYVDIAMALFFLFIEMHINIWRWMSMGTNITREKVKGMPWKI